MSHAATNWAIKQRGIKPAAKIVLWQLCDRYHPDNGCFPSQEVLADDCEMSRSALNSHLDALERGRLIAREVRRDPVTQQQERTRYRFPFEPDFEAVPTSTDLASPSPDSGHGPESEKEPEPSPENDESRVRNPDSNPVREPVREPVKVEREGARATAKIDDPRPWEHDSDFMAAMRSWWTVDGIANAWREWGKMEPAARAEAKRKIPVYLAMHQTRSERCAFSTYLGQRPFRLLPEPAADGEAPPVRTELPAMSRAWCFVFFRLVADATASAIRRAREMLSDAEFGKNAYVPIGEMPTDSDVAGLVKIERGGAAFMAWRRWLSTGASPVWLKPEAFGEWLWVPSEWPAGQEPIEGKNEQEETKDDRSGP